MKNCINCGNEMQDFENKCLKCGYEFNGLEIKNDIVTNPPKSSFKDKFVRAITKNNVLKYLICCLIFFVLAIIFFAFEIKMFYFDKSIVNVCILLEVIWSIFAVLNIILIIVSLCFRNKKNKK